jgi:copper chaperone CopZ
MPHITLFVAAMTCRRCVREVTARLRDVPGVETVTANAGDSLVRLSGDMEVADVLSAFTGTTYRPTVRPDVRPDLGGDSGGTAVGQPTS